MIFIDGDHSHPQVTKDFHGVKHLGRDDTVFGSRDRGISERTASLFEDTEAPIPRSRPMAWLHLYATLLSGSIRNKLS